MKNVLTAVPNVRLTAGSLRRRQNIILVAVLIAALTGPLAFVMSLGGSDPVVQTAPESSGKTITFATTVAEDFLAGGGTNMPAAAGVDRMFGRSQEDVTAMRYSSLEYRESTITVVGGSRVDVVRFALETYDFGFMTLSVPVTFTDAGRQILAATPSMVPATFATDGSASAPQPELTTGEEIPDNVEERIQLWAEAFAADDSQALRVLVNDSDAPAGGSYLGLGGFTCPRGCSEVLWATPSTVDTSLVNVRVRTLFVADSANGFVMSNEFDLLVRGWNSDAPRVLAWGPAGFGSLLAPYINNTAR